MTELREILIDLPVTITQCAPHVAVSTMLAIIKTESRFNTWAINLNRGHHLRYSAKSVIQAMAWVDYLEAHNYDFDVGLGQVNIRNVHKYGYKAREALDPCINLRIAGQILQRNYHQARKVSANSKEALYKAISAYNTGNYHSGFHNGYVQKVVNNAKT